MKKPKLLIVNLSVYLWKKKTCHKEVTDLQVIILYGWTQVAIRLKLTVYLCDLRAVSCLNSREPKQWKMLFCLHAFGAHCALLSQMHFTQPGLKWRLPVPLCPATTPDATFLGNTPPLSYRSCLAFCLSYVCQHLSSPTSLIPPSLHCISTELLCTVGFPWQPSPTCSRSAKSRGIRCSSPLLATPLSLLESDWLACLPG